LLSKPEKYCHNRGMAFAHHHGAGLAWDRKVDDGPFAWSPETAVLQGKSWRVRGPRPLGAAMDSSGFFLLVTRSTATTGA
jgi:hypothetical protein